MQQGMWTVAGMMTTEGSRMSETLLQMTKGIGVSHPPLHGTECSIELRPPLQTTEGSEVSHPPLQLTEGSGVFCSLLQTTSGVSHPPLLTIECNIVSHPPLQRMMVVMCFIHSLLQMTQGSIYLIHCYRWLKATSCTLECRLTFTRHPAWRHCCHAVSR